MKKLFIGFVLFSGIRLSVQAEDFPIVQVLGSSPSAEYISTIQTLITDGKGDIVVNINIYNAWGDSVYQLETAQECLNDDCLKVAKQEAIDMSLVKLQKFNIDTKLRGAPLYTYLRADRQVDESYRFPTRLKLMLDGPTAIFLSYDLTGDDEHQYHQLSIKKEPSNAITEFYISNFDPVFSKVGTEQVVRFKGSEGKVRILVISASQTLGFEGPNTNFTLSFFDL